MIDNILIAKNCISGAKLVVMAIIAKGLNTFGSLFITLVFAYFCL